MRRKDPQQHRWRGADARHFDDHSDRNLGDGAALGQHLGDGQLRGGTNPLSEHKLEANRKQRPPEIPRRPPSFTLSRRLKIAPDRRQAFPLANQSNLKAIMLAKRKRIQYQ
jgi:hypothetical protein